MIGVYFSGIFFKFLTVKFPMQKKRLLQDIGLTAPAGIEGINEVITTCRLAFEHLNVTIEDMVAEGDKVVARFTAQGIHKGDFMNLPATGKPITMTGIEIFRIKGGKIAELWGEVNLLGLMQQLGIFSSP